MNLFVDQDVYASTVAILRTSGHDDVSAADRSASQSDDRVLLQIAISESRVFFTRDRDFGGLVYQASLGSGVIYLRVLPSTLQSVHLELARILNLYLMEDLLGSFVVVEPGRHRIRKPHESHDH